MSRKQEMIQIISFSFHMVTRMMYSCIFTSIEVSVVKTTCLSLYYSTSYNYTHVIIPFLSYCKKSKWGNITLHSLYYLSLFFDNPKNTVGIKLRAVIKTQSKNPNDTVWKMDCKDGV